MLIINNLDNSFYKIKVVYIKNTVRETSKNTFKKIRVIINEI